MKTTRRILITLMAAGAVALAAPGGAMATVTTEISSSDSFGSWVINYDDVTRNVVGQYDGVAFRLITVQVTATASRTVAEFPAASVVSKNQALATQMAVADFTVISGAGPTILVSNVAPNQVARIVGKATATLGGFQETEQASLT